MLSLKPFSFFQLNSRFSLLNEYLNLFVFELAIGFSTRLPRVADLWIRGVLIGD